MLNITWDADNKEVHITPHYEYEKGYFDPANSNSELFRNDDLNKSEYITTQEALNTITKILYNAERMSVIH